LLGVADSRVARTGDIAARTSGHHPVVETELQPALPELHVELPKRTLVHPSTGIIKQSYIDVIPPSYNDRDSAYASS
jgi:hypothetical protein